MRWCHDLVKHWGAGWTPRGRGQQETDKCAAPGVGRGSPPHSDPTAFPGAPALAAAQLRTAACSPCPASAPGGLQALPAVLHPAPRTSPASLPRCPDPSRSSTARPHSSFTALPRPERLFLGGSRPAARLSSPRHPASRPALRDSPTAVDLESEPTGLEGAGR